MNNNHNIPATRWEPGGEVLVRKTRQFGETRRDAITGTFPHSVALKNPAVVSALCSVTEINSNRKSSPQSQKLNSIKTKEISDSNRQLDRVFSEDAERPVSRQANDASMTQRPLKDYSIYSDAALVGLGHLPTDQLARVTCHLRPVSSNLRQWVHARIAAMPAETETIAANVERVRERIARAAERVGRRAEEITLVAVSKTFPAAFIREAYAAGIRHFGENRVQEWEEKHRLLEGLAATWHLVGHLQSNKAKRAARLFHAVDSLHSLALARKLDAAVAEAAAEDVVEAGGAASSDAAHAQETGRLQVLIEVQLAPEETKTGVSETELPRLAEAVFSLPHLDLRGLMTIPPYFDDPERLRPFFRKLRELRDGLSRSLGLSLPELSMGMSHDFEAGIEECATQVRLGTAIFGARQVV